MAGRVEAGASVSLVCGQMIQRSWMATRDWARLQEVGGFAEGDVRLENY